MAKEYTSADIKVLSGTAGQKVERKYLVTLVGTYTGSAPAPKTPDYTTDWEWSPVGFGVEDSSLEYNPDTETVTDIFGITETTVNKLELQQNLEPLTAKQGSAIHSKLIDIVERNAVSEFAQFPVMIVRAYLNDGTDETPKFHAEVHTNCTVTPQSEGGSSYVDMPININFSNDKTLGTVNSYKYNDTITFTKLA